MSKNGNIVDFFKRMSQNQPSSQSPRSPQKIERPKTPTYFDDKQAALSPSSPPAFLPPAPISPNLFSSPIAPPPKAGPRPRDAVIKGSDDEDDDDDLISSDDELPDLFSKPRDVIPMPSPRKHSTPRTKRTAYAFHSSPLTIMPKHKFDFKALMKHAEADNRLEAHMTNASDDDAEDTGPVEAAVFSVQDGNGAAQRAGASLHDTMVDVMDVFSDPEGSQEEGNREKLLRAVKRTETTAQRKRFRFFDPQRSGQQQRNPSASNRAPFPVTKATAIWRFLAPAETRSDFFEDGVVYQIQARTRCLPDEIFLWILDEIPTEKSKKLRDEYLRILGKCPDQARKLMDEDYITRLFRYIGASEEALQRLPPEHDNTSMPEDEWPPTTQRDWTPLRAVLRILSETAKGMMQACISRSVAILLRLGMDNLIHEDPEVKFDYHKAFLGLVRAVPPSSWDSFCGNVCASLYKRVKEVTQRCDAVYCIPLADPLLVDLRRRLALVCLFEDLKYASSPPSESFTMRDVRELLDREEKFVVHRERTDAFYLELSALTDLLSVAIGDGSPPSLDTTAPPLGVTPPPQQGNPEEEKDNDDNDDAPSSKTSALQKFDQEVDKVASQIKDLMAGIPRKGAAVDPPVEASAKLKDLEGKLLQVTRSRPPKKAGDLIIGAAMTVKEEYGEEERPRQQAFMKRFLQKNRREKTPILTEQEERKLEETVNDDDGIM